VRAWEGCDRAPRAWQAAALPVIVRALREGRRGLVSATPGAGKSVLQAEIARLATPRLDRDGGCVVFSVPSEKLVTQLAGTLRDRVGDRVGVYYGKRRELGADVLVLSMRSAGRFVEETAGRPVRLLCCDEAHKTETGPFLAAVDAMAPEKVAGFTGTPFRSAPTETIRLFDEVLVRYTFEQAVADGVLVPPDVRWVEGRQVLDVDAEMIRMMGDVSGPGVVDAVDIADADAFALRLVAEGWRAESIHSGHSDEEQARKLADLEAGRLAVLVHVNLLAEGVDFPWLMWLGLRRNIGARVRFLQYVGRVLRAHPGKDRGVILDPRCLLGRHGWTTAEAIGAALDTVAEAEVVDRPVSDREPDEALSVALAGLLDGLQAIHDGLRTRGLVEPARVGDWQIAGVTERQVEALIKARKLTRHVPADVRPIARALARVPWALSRGEASALMDVLYAGVRFAHERVRQGDNRPPYMISWPAEWIRADVDTGAASAVERWGDRVARREARV